MKHRNTTSPPKQPAGAQAPRLNRTTFTTSRLLDFFSEKELVAQIGHERDKWPLAAIKELLDNSLDACEEAGVPPTIDVAVTADKIVVRDNEPGIPAETLKGVIDYSVGVSNREAYVSPTRGAQGNALKTVLAMPFVLDGERGVVVVESRGERHKIICEVDRIRQRPVVSVESEPCKGRTESVAAGGDRRAVRKRSALGNALLRIVTESWFSPVIPSPAARSRKGVPKHGEMGRDSAKGFGERGEQAGDLPGVQAPLGYAPADSDVRGAAEV
jgi:hypothetical protein